MRRAVGLPERDGVLVRAVEDGSPAAESGIERGDLIVAASGREVDGVDALHRAVDEAAGNGGLELTLVRGTDEREVKVEFERSAA
jgi:S1-C subfamily serine protease